MNYRESNQNVISWFSFYYVENSFFKKKNLDWSSTNSYPIETVFIWQINTARYVFRDYRHQIIVENVVPAHHKAGCSVMTDERICTYSESTVTSGCPLHLFQIRSTHEYDWNYAGFYYSIHSCQNRLNLCRSNCVRCESHSNVFTKTKTTDVDWVNAFIDSSTG